MLKIIDGAYQDEVIAAAAAKVDFTKPGIGMEILTKHKGMLSKVKRAEPSSTSEKVEYSRKMSMSRGSKNAKAPAPSSASFVDKVFATLNETELRQALDMDEVGYDMKEQLARRLVAVTTDANLLVSFYDGDMRGRINDNDREAVIVKLAGMSEKITDSKVIIKILKAVESHSLENYIKDPNERVKLLSRLSEDEAVKYALDEVDHHSVYSWNKDKMLPMDDAIAVTKIAKDPKSVVKIVSAILAKIASYQKECKDSWTMRWGKEDTDKANALIKKFPKFDDATVAALICSDATSWTYFMDTVSADVAYDVLSGGKAKSGDLELALVKKLPKNRIDMKVYNGARYDDAKKAINESMSPEMKKAAAEAMEKAFKDICTKAKDASKNTFELDGFYLGMTFDDMKVVFSHHFPSLQIKEAIDGEGKDADHVIYVPGQRSPFCYASVSDKKVYQFNFGKKLLKKWYQYDVQTPMEWAHAYERETKIDMKYKSVEKDTTVYEPGGSDSYRV